MPDDVTGDGRADGGLPRTEIYGWFFDVLKQQMR